METIILPIRISRAFITKHREWTFVYGGDILGKSFFGQAGYIANEPNSFPAYTIRKVCSNSIYLLDNSKEDLADLNRSLNAIPRHQLIIVLRKIGEGFSQMKYFAPKLFKHMTERLNEMKHPNITINYHNAYE